MRRALARAVLVAAFGAVIVAVPVAQGDSAPDTTIDSGPSGTVTSRSATFTFSSADATATFECSLDGGGFAACASPDTRSGLGDGSHTFSVQAVNAAGADPTPASRTWTVDTAPPNTTIDSGPSGTVTSRSATFTFSSTDATATFECNVDGAGFSGCSSPKGYGSLADGSHSFSVRARDPVGNVDPSPPLRSWTVAATPPDTSITSGPSGTVTSKSASFSFTSSGGTSFECNLDGGSFSTCSSPQSYSSLGDGQHTFSVRAKDANGLLDPTPASRSWTIDTTAPDTTLSGGPAQGSTVSATSATFSFSSTDGTATFECSLEGGAFASCTSPRTVSSLGNGSHTFSVRARDPVGNVDATPPSRTWTVDTTAPDTTLSGGPAEGSTVSATSATFSFSSTDGTATFECKLDSASFAACTSPDTVSGLRDGSHTFSVRARDPAGNVDASPPSRTWTVDAIAPDTTLSGGPSGTVSATSATFSFSSTDGTATFECKLDSASFAACASPVTVSGLGDGSHTFSVRAHDPVGNIDATPTSRTWTVDTTAPDTTLSGGPSGVVSATSATFSFSSTDGTATFECSLDGGAFGTCTSPRTVSGLKDGSHTFSVRAHDPAGNVDATPSSLTWTIDTVAPTLVVPANGVTAEANGPTGSKVNFTVTGSDGSNALLPNQITCVPASGSLFPLGKTTVTCNTTPDAAGNIGSASFAVTVVDTTPPQLSVPGDFGVYATSEAGIASSDSAVASVLGAAKAVDLVDPKPVVTNNAPVVLPHGTTTVTFTAKDATGNTATKATHITVTDRPPSGSPAPAPAPVVVDTTPPADPGSFVGKVGPGTIRLSWKLPTDSDFDHVEVFRSVQQQPRATAAPAETRVYSGTGKSFVDKGLKAGTEYRYLIASFDKTGNRSAGSVVVAVAKAALLLAPADGARVSRVPTLQWKAVTGAAYYNVQIFRGGKKVLSAWPTGTSLRLQLSWKYNGTRYTLAPGLYHWYVWPGLGARAAGRYGAVMGDRTFTVLKGVKP